MIPDMTLVALGKFVAIVILIDAMIAFAVLANVFVIVAIIMDRDLRTIDNYLIVSLAIADLLIAVIVMPIKAIYEINSEWPFGADVCDIWTSCSVLCCTASILHLVAIAADRYWSVKDIHYRNLRTPCRIYLTIFNIWFAALFITVPPHFGFKDSKYLQRINKKICIVSQDVAYRIFSSCCAFYIPLVIILLLYWKIYKIAKMRIKGRAQEYTQPTRPANQVQVVQFNHSTGVSRLTLSDQLAIATHQQCAVALPRAGLNNPLQLEAKRRKLLKAQRERKAAQTLVIITGTFVACWLPYFVAALLLPFCTNCKTLGRFSALFLWLGYFNSLLNPIIYTIFNPKCRSAFYRLVFGRKSKTQQEGSG